MREMTKVHTGTSYFPLPALNTHLQTYSMLEVGNEKSRYERLSFPSFCIVA